FADNRCDFFVCRRASKLSRHQGDPLYLVACRAVAARAVGLKQASTLCHLFGRECVLREKRACEENNNDQNFHTYSNLIQTGRKTQRHQDTEAQRRAVKALDARLCASVSLCLCVFPYLSP